MPHDIFLSALVFVLVASFTPGPNNTMLLASGVNYGFRRTLPHLLGITIGYGWMFTAVALGIGKVFATWPGLYDVLRVVSAVYLLWLAWKIANAAGHGGNNTGESSAPLTFLQAALFQWVNPKGVAAALAAAANFLRPEHLATDLPVMLGLMFAVSFASGGTWTLFGQSLRSALADETRRVWFNRVMALALVASLWPMLANGLPR